MSGVFYVFLKWSTNNPTDAANHGRYMLCLNSRYDADELFREMQYLRTTDKGGLMFPLLTRQSPQFWCYDSPEGWPSVKHIQERGEVSKFKNTLSTISLSGLQDHCHWPVIPNPVSGPDWVSGGDFFIRNRRQPDLYWNLHHTNFRTSTKQRTKFRIQKMTPGMREPTIMIREDKITIRVIPETVTSAAVANNSMFISIDVSTGNRLKLTNIEYDWTFGSLVSKDVGVRWVNEGRVDEQSETAEPFLVRMLNGGGDEWELV